MNINQKIYLTTLFLFIMFSSKGQQSVGEWNNYISSTPKKIIATPNYIYANHGTYIISVNKIDNTATKISRTNVLSDYIIADIAFNSANNALVIGYANGNVDVLVDNQITNISDIQFLQSKLNGVFCENDYAYLSLRTGIIKLNIRTRQIEDYCMFTTTEIFNITASSTSLYAATSKGIYFIAKNNTGFADYHNWNVLNLFYGWNGAYKLIDCLNDTLYTVKKYNNQDTIIRIAGTNISYKKANNILSLKSSEHKIIYSDNGIIYSFPQTILFYNLNSYDAVFDIENILWVSTANNEIVKVPPNNQFEYFRLNLPYSSNSFELKYSKNNLYVAAGAFYSSWNNSWKYGEINILNNGTWETFNHSNTPVLNSAFDIVTICPDTSNPSHFFAGAWGRGLIEFNNSSVTEIYNDSNSTLQSILSGYSNIRIGGIAYDKYNNLWVTNYGVSSPISVKTSDGSWYNFPYGATINNDLIGQIIVTKNNHKWAVLPRGGGLFAFDELNTFTNTSDDIYKKFTIKDSLGYNITSDVNAITEDISGKIWVGTNKGVYVYSTAANVFTNSPFYAEPVKIDTISNTTFLYDYNVVSICIDKQNNKWFGTDDAGVFCLSSDNKQVLYSFSKNDFPIYSNYIKSIAVADNGEIFFGTDQGILSFIPSQNNSIITTITNQETLLYPNPNNGKFILKFYNPNNKMVLICVTDIAGRIIFEASSMGEKYEFKSIELQSGIYLIKILGEKEYFRKMVVN